MESEGQAWDPWVGLFQLWPPQPRGRPVQRPMAQKGLAAEAQLPQPGCMQTHQVQCQCPAAEQSRSRKLGLAGERWRERMTSHLMESATKS